MFAKDKQEPAAQGMQEIQRPERRNYIRIEDRIMMRYRPLSDNDILDPQALQMDEDQKNPLRTLLFINERLDQNIRLLAKQDRDLANICKLFNEKINVLATQVLDQKCDRFHDELSAHNVSISASGISFANSEYLEVGSKVLVELLLHTTLMRIVAVAEVIACDEVEAENVDAEMEYETVSTSDPYILRLEFYKMEEEDQEQLIQHVVRTQSTQLQKKRESRLAEENPLPTA